MNKQALIAKLKGTEPVPYVYVDRQSFGDIVKAMSLKQKECTEDYDRIYKDFAGGDIYDICERLWKFCRKQLNYEVEPEEEQNTSAPITILRTSMVDCKNYSLFIAGVLDAFKRHGMDITWNFRYASYDIFNPVPGHVFVVVNKNSDNIWVDPCIDEFNSHVWYWYKRDKSVKTSGAKVAGIGMHAIGSSAEQNILDELYQYTEGLVGAIQLTQQTNTFNAITKQFLAGITGNVPGLAQGLKFLNSASAVINNAFGPGSEAAMLFADYASNPLLFPINAIETLFNGRTYNTDQYWGAAYYYYHVLGKANYTNQNQVADSQVVQGLKWFIDRTGVFISGREHIDALTVSAAKYMSYHSVNGYTTMDINRVNAAVAVAQQYWQNPTVFANPGGWANTIGVYDTGLAQLAAKLGETAEQLAAQTGYQTITSSTSTATDQLIPGVNNIWLYAACAALAVYGLTKKSS